MTKFDPDTWRFINSFAPWLSALGTMAAVITSLYFARKDKRVRLEVSAGHRIIISQGASKPFPEVLNIRIVNIGHRDVQLTNIGWKVGIFKKRFSVQTTIQDRISSQLPIRLKDGEEANYYIPFNTEPTRWAESFRKMLHPFPKLQVRFIKIIAHTSIGKKFESSIEKSLSKQLLALNKDPQQSGAVDAATNGPRH